MRSDSLSGALTHITAYMEVAASVSALNHRKTYMLLVEGEGLYGKRNGPGVFLSYIKLVVAPGAITPI